MIRIVIPKRRQERGDTAAVLIAANEVLLAKEWCIETDTGGVKRGDGITNYINLPYVTDPFFVAATGTNTLVATFAAKPVLRDGLELRVRAAAANTGAATFNPNSLGALAVKKQGGTALAAGDIVAAGHELLLRYVTGSPGHYELLNPGTSSVGAELAAIAALTPSNDDIIQRKAGAWVNRSVAQYSADLGLASYALQSYVDAAVAGLSWKQAVRFKTTANVNLSGGGLAAGTTHDGVTAVAGDRALVASQTTGSQNGFYIVPASGAASRATDADSGAELVNASCYVSEGTLNADTQWTCTTNSPITVGTTSLAFAQLSSGTVDIAALTHAATSKATPVDADELPLVDSAASNALKKLTVANLKALIFSALGALIAAGTGKTTPADADSFAISDSAASNATKQLTYASLKSAIATYIGTLIPGSISGTPPLAANFTTFGTSVVMTDKVGRLQLTMPASTTAGQIRGMIQTASLPAAPYTIDMRGGIIAPPGGSDCGELGLFLSNGTAYRYVAFGGADIGSHIDATCRARVISFTTATTGGAIVTQGGFTMNFADFYLRITDDGTTRRYWLSNNGKDFQQISSESNTTGFTATKCGICIYHVANVNLVPPKASIMNWLITGSVLGDAA